METITDFTEWLAGAEPEGHEEEICLKVVYRG